MKNPKGRRVEFESTLPNTTSVSKLVSGVRPLLNQTFPRLAIPTCTERVSGQRHPGFLSTLYRGRDFCGRSWVLLHIDNYSLIIVISLKNGPTYNSLTFRPVVTGDRDIDYDERSDRFVRQFRRCPVRLVFLSA